MSDLYDQDVFEWSQQQAALLRRHAAGERLNQEPDWTNIIEEVESGGRAKSTRSNLSCSRLSCTI